MPLWLRRMTFQKLKEFFDAKEKASQPRKEGEIDMANPNKSKIPDRKTISGPIRELIEKQYKSFDNFKDKFVEEALAHFGSGWLWLVKKGNKLEIIPTNNQDNPLMDSDVTILLGIDVWEHAYYKKYGPNREKYIKQFLKIVNWDYCNQQLMQ